MLNPVNYFVIIGLMFLFYGVYLTLRPKQKSQTVTPKYYPTHTTVITSVYFEALNENVTFTVGEDNCTKIKQIKADFYAIEKPNDEIQYIYQKPFSVVTNLEPFVIPERD